MLGTNTPDITERYYAANCQEKSIKTSHVKHKTIRLGIAAGRPKIQFLWLTDNHVLVHPFLQCFDVVCWMTEMTPGLQKKLSAATLKVFPSWTRLTRNHSKK